VTSPTAASTLFLRLEGPLQAWGDTSKFVIRRSMEVPTKSGVLGLVCCAMGLSRAEAREQMPQLVSLAMGVRIDRPGTRWWDYHTVGAGVGLTTAGGGVKTGAQGTLITRREYLADASFLVALRGEPTLIARVASALASPKWPIFLGRKSCSPSVPVLAHPREGEAWQNPSDHADLPGALAAVPWSPRYDNDAPRDSLNQRLGTINLETIIEWRAASDADNAPDDAEVWYDSPVCFDPPVHEPRLVVRGTITAAIGRALLQRMPAPARPRADYQNAEYKKRRALRLEADHGLCVFCKAPGTTVQHVTYRRAGGDESQEDLRALCRLCHDAVTMVEYGQGMTMDRIDPCQPKWREDILRTRAEILRHRSLEVRRRHLTPEEVE
jgi:CRISPR-associated protein Cas5/CasD subtype I-E